MQAILFNADQTLSIVCAVNVIASFTTVHEVTGTPTSCKGNFLHI